MSDQLEKLLAQKPMKKPPSRWFNWYLAPFNCEVEHYRTREIWVVKRGDVFSGETPHPSRDVAEQTAADLIRRDKQEGIQPLEYLGAFPEGERP